MGLKRLRSDYCIDRVSSSQSIACGGLVIKLGCRWQFAWVRHRARHDGL